MSLADAQSLASTQWGEELWKHPDPTSTSMHKFLQLMNKKHNLDLKGYHDLHAWSTSNVVTFWDEVWQFVGIRSSSPYTKVLDEAAPMFPRPRFFDGAKLNFAENLLYPSCGVEESSVAIIEATETRRENVTWKRLRARVHQCQLALKSAGIGKDDRVAGYVGNHVNGVVAMLAATSLGALYTALSPDNGSEMAKARLAQITPKILFADDGQFYNGKRFETVGKVAEVLSEIDSIKTAVIFDVVGAGKEKVNVSREGLAILSYEEICEEGGKTEGDMTFEQMEADHPVYILYSSGTTGAPKCIVHGAIGTLLQHKKEHVLHCSILPGERVLYYTTATWMMWHWLVSALGSGATIVLYDGSPMRYTSSASDSATPVSTPDDLAMPRLISELSINHFGTSAKYLSLLEQKSLYPKQPPHNINLSSLRAIYNTASPLAPSTFRYVYRAFGPDINLASITGGTDIISLFGAGSPLNPVYAGEIQIPGLGMAVRAYTDDGKDITASGEPGDLVCTKPFPSQPVAFWGADGDAKYRKSYFERFEGVWHHGDFVVFNPKSGGMVMLGRSDGVSSSIQMIQQALLLQHISFFLNHHTGSQSRRDPLRLRRNLQHPPPPLPLPNLRRAVHRAQTASRPRRNRRALPQTRARHARTHARARRRHQKHDSQRAERTTCPERH